MEKEFIPYEQALALKELGFGSAYWIGGYQGGKVFYYEKGNLYYDGRPMYSSDSHSGQIEAPLYQQAFRWFREKYNLIPDIQYYGNWNFEIFRIDELAEPMDDVNVDYTFRGGTYEEAELECLKKLIEIVKQ